MNRYYIQEFVPGRWHVRDRRNFNLPLYDENGEKPIIFDEDRAYEVLKELNEGESVEL